MDPLHPHPRTWLALCVLLVGCSCSQPETVDEFVAREQKHYSQGNEELLIRHFFADRRGGVFVDVGAFRWKQHSTTYYLEKHLGWSGIAVDANESLREGYERNRPATRFHAYIVTDEVGGEQEFFVAGPVSSTSKEHVERYVRSADNRSRWVPTMTLDRLLAEEGLGRIDFLSMDIELGEPAALAGFDIERFRPELVCIEVGNATVREEISVYFDQHGYERIDPYLPHDRVNWYYRRKQR